MIGKNILHYKILEKLGEGGMGVVYLADDTKLERRVAIKFLPKHIAASSDERKRFQIEAKAAAALNHPNIATIHAIEEHDDEIFIVMEYIDGQELKEIVNHQSSIKNVLDLATQIASGLLVAHEKGIIHRDIKSSNIMITDKGQAKIMDFGLAKVGGSAQLTQSGTTVGTAAYMSPEQTKGDKVDQRSDIWSFGVVLYEMLSGKLPFPGEYNQAVQYAIVNSEPEPLKPKLSEEVPLGLLGIIEKCLDKDIETRYQSLADVLVDLKRVQKGSTAVSQTYSALNHESSTITGVKPKFLFTLRNLSIAICGMAFIYLLIVFFFRNDFQETTSNSNHTRITFSGNLTGAAISPDSKSIAYIKQITKFDSEIIVRDIKSNNELIIFEGKVYTDIPLKWTHDGTQLLFHRVTSNSSLDATLVSRFGGSTKHLSKGRVWCFSPDGIKFIAEPIASKSINIFDINSNEKTKIGIEGDFTWRYEIDWSSINNKLLFVTKSSHEFSIWVIDINGKHQKKIISSNNKIRSPFWAKDGKSIYYFIDFGSKKNLYKVKVDNSNERDAQSKLIENNLKAGDNFSISDNNKLIIYEGITEYSNLKLYEKQKDVFVESALTNGTALTSTPSISPDNQWVAYGKGDYDISNIFISSLVNNEKKQITFLDAYCFYPSWSPNTDSLVFCVDENGKVSVKKLSLSDRKSEEVQTGDLSAGTGELNWFNKDKIIYHLPGNRNYMFYDLITKEMSKLLENDSLGWIFNPRFAPDNSKIAVFWNRYEPNAFDYENRKSIRGLWIISLQDGSKKRLTENDYPWPLRWSSDGKWIYAFDEAEPTEILKIDAKTGESTQYYKLPFNLAGDIDISSDGNIIVATEITKLSDVWMMENFDPEVN